MRLCKCGWERRPRAAAHCTLLATLQVITQKVVRKQDCITAVNRSHPAYTGFAGMPGAAGACGGDGAAAAAGGNAGSGGKAGGGGKSGGGGGSKVSISYCFRAPSSLRPVFGEAGLRDKERLYEEAEVEAALGAYAAAQGESQRPACAVAAAVAPPGATRCRTARPRRSAGLRALAHAWAAQQPTRGACARARLRHPACGPPTRGCWEARARVCSSSTCWCALAPSVLRRAGRPRRACRRHQARPPAARLAVQ